MFKKIRWLRLALSDLDELINFIARNNPNAAANVARDIWKISGMLEEYPAMGKPGRVPGTREMVVPGTQYIMPYRVVDDEVQILRVLHGARKWPQSF